MAQQKKETDEKEKELKLDIDEDERKRRSELAKKLHAEGKFGGKQRGAGRPKKPRAQEHVAEVVRDKQEQISKALVAALESGQPATRLKAALAMLEIEQKEQDHIFRQEQRAYDNLSREKLLELIGQRIKQLNDSGVEFDMEGEATEILTKQLNA